MSTIHLKLRPGVEAEYTPTLNEAGITSSQLIRFKDGLPQKLGGWARFYANSVAGVPKKMHGWGDLAQVDRLAIGTTLLLGTVTDSTFNTLTPQTLLSNFAEDFSTVSGSNIVTVVDPNISNVTTYDAVFFNTPITVGGLYLHGLYPIAVITGANSYQILANAKATATVNNGGAVPVLVTISGSAIVTVTFANHGLAVEDDFNFPIATVFAGVTVFGTYNVLTVPDANHFTIGVTTSATSGVTRSMNTGSAQLVYYISLGPPAVGTGFGIGGFGIGGYGTGAVGSDQTGVPITALNWSLDNWGEFLMACPKNGGIYFWPPNRGYETAFLVATAPPFNGGLFVSMPAQILVAWGSCAGQPGSLSTTRSPEQRDPLIVRWSDVEDFTNWRVTSLTQAGSYRLSSGSEIRGALQVAQSALIWTDISVWTMEYMGPPYVFGFTEIGKGCGLIAQHGACTLSDTTYWMSQGGFFMKSPGAGVAPLPCTVWDVIFQDLDMDNADKVVAAANSLFNEVTFYYPSITDGTGQNSRYVKYNASEGVWDYGVVPRSAWIDQTVLGNPIGSTPNGIIYQHEISPNAGSNPMTSWFETGYFMLEEGQDFSFIDKFYPDMKWGTRSSAPDASVLITITAIYYPNSEADPTTMVSGPFEVNATVNYADPRLRGRQAKIRMESNDANSFWRMGQPSLRVTADGRR